jgi:hypothetical protein
MSGPTLSGTECDRRKGKFKHLELSKEERRNGARNTSNGKKPIPSTKRAKTSEARRHGQMARPGITFKRMLRIQEERENPPRWLIHAPPERANHGNLYIGLVPQGGAYRRKLGEWLKMTSVRSQDQRRMLQATTHSFPSNAWIHKTTKGKESNKCDLCKALWIAENRFTTEAALPEQDLGHIQHTLKPCQRLTQQPTTDAGG